MAQNALRRFRPLQKHTRRKTISLNWNGTSCIYGTAQQTPTTSIADLIPIMTRNTTAGSRRNNPNLIRSTELREKRRKVQKTLNIDTINQDIRKMEYAVKGPLVVRAGEIEKEISAGIAKPFETVIRANIGDCHAMGQPKVTYPRQVMALCTHELLFDDPTIPDDAKDHARRILASCQGQSLGSYTESAGLKIVREDIAAFISRRDGFSCDPDNIILTAGAGEGIKNTLELLKNTTGKRAGAMIPIPQYPLYTASISQYGLYPINYYMDEDNDWALDIQELRRAVDAARANCDPKAICVINPGNPTGQVMTRQNIEDTIKFAYEEQLCILADEVYQGNIHSKDHTFHSFRKVLYELGLPYSDQVELISFHSVSKGYMGECGLRAGYLEAVNIDPAVFQQLMKTFLFCSNTPGQVSLDCLVRPPQPGNPSFSLFQQQTDEIATSLAERATLVSDLLNTIPGMQCNPVYGSMFAFPRLRLPETFLNKSKAANQPADFRYAMQLLENTGICVVPGSGFGQKPGSYHFRTTILPPKEILIEMLGRLKDFHHKFLERES
ncbi:alanine aminotransferase 1-like [Paramacrobiotus metropolitanus]|uniref:alanine aminotransferase 1-like n=1 Tax=Paramacrobiotus metropolitanus TaxID=2943436 RepID=UPI002445ACCB|nr:alanine aminotransferase 1-like [Paramacrobiotus metropolitanus]